MELAQVMPLHIVKWMFFSGEPISADQALQIGFLNDVVPVEKLEQRTGQDVTDWVFSCWSCRILTRWGLKKHHVSSVIPSIWNSPILWSPWVSWVRTQEMAHIIASRAPLVVHLLKRQLLCMSPAPSLTPEVFEELHEKRKQTWSSNDMEEGVQAFFAKRPPSFRGN